MKVLTLAILMAFCCSTFARTPLWRKVEALEKKVAELEEKVNGLVVKSSGSQTSSGLKVKDIGNSKVSGSDRSISGMQDSQISIEQQREIQQQLELYKSKQLESQKLLQELMDEDL